MRLKKLWNSTLLITLGAVLHGSSVFGVASLEEGVSQIAEQITKGINETSVQQIAVVEFTGLNGDVNALGQILAEELVTQIFRAEPGRFQVVERNRLDRVIREQKLSRSSLFEKESRAAIAQLLSVDVIITGTLADLGTTIKVNARAVSIETGSVFAVGAANIPKTEHISRLFEKPGRQQGHLSDHHSSSKAGLQSKRRSPRFFENKFFRIEYRTLSRSSDYETVQMALFLEVKVQDDLLVGVEIEDRFSRTMTVGRRTPKGSPTAILTEKGDSAPATTVTGISSVDHNDDDPEDFSVINTGNRYPIGITFERDRSGRISGEVFNLSAQFVILKDGRRKPVTVTLSNLQVE